MLTAALRRTGNADVADALRDAVQGGATSTEILGRIGTVLRAHDDRRAGLGVHEQRAWDAVMRDVNRSQPPRALLYWFRRRLHR